MRNWLSRLQLLVTFVKGFFTRDWGTRIRIPDTNVYLVRHVCGVTVPVSRLADGTWSLCRYCGEGWTPEAFGCPCGPCERKRAERTTEGRERASRPRPGGEKLSTWLLALFVAAALAGLIPGCANGRSAPAGDAGACAIETCLQSCEAASIAHEACWQDTGPADAGCSETAGTVYRAVTFCTWYCTQEPQP